MKNCYNRKCYTAIILLLSIVRDSLANPEKAKCCASNQYLINKNEDYVCYDTMSNATQNMWLMCKTDVFSGDDFNFTVTEYGELDVRLDDSYTEPLGVGRFCVGNDNTTGENTYVALICSEEEGEDFIDDRIVGICMLISVIFFTLCSVTYAILPELRDLQGKSIINYSGSMALGLALLASMKLLDYEDLNLCAVRAFLTYFFIIAAFFWMNAIAIQILLSLRRPTVTNYHWKDFIWYAIYSWGCSAVLTIIMIIVNYHPGKHRKPGIGLQHCWFYSTTSQWHYMYSVMTILILSNICIFIYTSFIIWKQAFSSTQTRALRFKFFMTLKIFIIMGLPWIFEMLSSVSKANIVWELLDLFNALEGPLIFLILVVLRRRVVKALHKRGMLFCLSNIAEKYLAANEDDEGHIVEHTSIPLDDTK